jgi:hypothetical protein
MEGPLTVKAPEVVEPVSELIRYESNSKVKRGEIRT